VPALYSDFPLSALHLIAFSTNGRVLADTLVTAHVPGGDVSVVCPFPEMCFTGKIPPGLSPPPCLNPSRCLTEVTGWSPPDVAVWQDPRGGTPMMIVSDVYRPFLKGVKSAPLSFNQPTRSSAKGADLPNSSETYNSLVPQRLNRVLGQFNDGMAEADAIAILGPDCRWRCRQCMGACAPDVIFQYPQSNQLVSGELWRTARNAVPVDPAIRTPYTCQRILECGL
jgi:hypothetical protein